MQPSPISHDDHNLPRHHFYTRMFSLLSLQDINNYDDNTKSQSLKDHVYDELLQSILFIAKKLNLKTVKEKSEVIFSDFLFYPM